MTKKSNTILHYEQIIGEKDKRIAELEKALNKASNMFAILVPPNTQMVTNCEGIYFNSVECQYEWLMNYAREEKAKENNNGN